MLTDIERERFSAAASAVLSGDGVDCGIGALSERSLHRILKLYTDPCRENHEVSYLGYVVDVMNSDGITEVQTRDFARLLPKLEALLAEERVTVIYPITRIRTLVWLDPLTGETSKPRRSPRRGRLSDALPELSRISHLVGGGNLTVKLFLLDTEDYKVQNGRGKDRKHYAMRYERLPTELVDIVELCDVCDYAQLLPDALSDGFTAADFDRATALRARRSHFSLKFLLELGLLTREKDGRVYRYYRTEVNKK